jgi:hypothetical protein
MVDTVQDTSVEATQEQLEAARLAERVARKAWQAEPFNGALQEAWQYAFNYKLEIACSYYGITVDKHLLAQSYLHNVIEFLVKGF